MIIIWAVAAVYWWVAYSLADRDGGFLLVAILCSLALLLSVIGEIRKRARR